jgi:hypothetical protein
MLAGRSDATAVADELEWMVRHHLALAQVDALPIGVGRLTPAAVAAAATGDLDPARLAARIEGRAAAIDATLGALGAAAVAD